MQDFIYLQAALANLSMALKFLDEIGCSVPAAHVETAIQSLKNDPLAEQSLAKLDRSVNRDFSALDEFIDQMFAPRHETVYLDRVVLPRDGA